MNPPVREAPAGAVLVLDGLFMHRDELRDARMAPRDGTSDDPEHPSLTRYVQGQRLFAECAPWTRDDMVVDDTDLDAPILAAPVLTAPVVPPEYGPHVTGPGSAHRSGTTDVNAPMTPKGAAGPPLGGP